MQIVSRQQERPVGPRCVGRGAREYAEVEYHFLETSAKNADNVEKAFLTMAQELAKSGQQGANQQASSVKLKGQEKSQNKCCS